MCGRGVIGVLLLAVLQVGGVAAAEPVEALLRVGESLLGGVVFNTITAAVSGRVEATIEVKRAFANPYDPQCVRLDGVISGPLGVRVYPCFYMVDVDEEGVARGGGEWRWRHAFRMEGEYDVRFRLLVAGREDEYTDSQRLVVKGRGQGGFARPDFEKAGVWVRDDGSRFFATGLNAAWFEEGKREAYRGVFEQCAAAGIEMVRVWMIGFARQELEWSEELWEPWNRGYGLGRYNQSVAAFFDWLFATAAEYGVYVQLVLETHGEWGTEVDGNWEFNPYNKDHGGFLERPAQFFTDQRATIRVWARYRYCVARWGAERALAAWELFNEVDHSDAIRLEKAELEVARWHAMMVRYIQRIDAVPRPVVSSSGDEEYLMRLARRVPELYRYDIHLYRDDAAAILGQMALEWQREWGHVPLICGEFGVAWESGTEPEQMDGVRAQIERMLWQGRVVGVPAWYWFWNKAEEAGVFKVHRALAEVFAGWRYEYEHRVKVVVEGGKGARAVSEKERARAGGVVRSRVIVYDSTFKTEALRPTISAAAVSDGARTVAYVCDEHFLMGNAGGGLWQGATLRMARSPVLTTTLRARFFVPATGATIGSSVAVREETGDIYIVLPPFEASIGVVLE